VNKEPRKNHNFRHFVLARKAVDAALNALRLIEAWHLAEPCCSTDGGNNSKPALIYLPTKVRFKLVTAYLELGNLDESKEHLQKLEEGEEKHICIQLESFELGC